MWTHSAALCLILYELQHISERVCVSADRIHAVSLGAGVLLDAADNVPKMFVVSVLVI